MLGCKIVKVLWACSFYPSLPKSGSRSHGGPPRCSTLHNHTAGRMALLWSTKKDAAYLTEAPLAYWEPYLSEGAISGKWRVCVCVLSKGWVGD